MFGEQLAIHAGVEDTRIIPLRLAEVKLPLRVEARVLLDFTEQADWEPEVARLRRVLHTAAPAIESLPCPYPGMRPFAAHDTRWFFGRDNEIEDLIARLDSGEREIHMVGPSGSGKSSLAHAGVMARLDAGSTRLGRSFLVQQMRPGGIAPTSSVRR